jgi:hypothetical protein
MEERKRKRFRPLSAQKVAVLKKQARKLDLSRFAERHARLSKGADVGNLIGFFNDTQALIEYARFLEKSVDELRYGGASR